MTKEQKLMNEAREYRREVARREALEREMRREKMIGTIINVGVLLVLAAGVVLVIWWLTLCKAERDAMRPAIEKHIEARQAARSVEVAVAW